MKITDQQRQAIVSGLESKRAEVVAARKKDADDVSSKWNDAREARAQRLDKERDALDSLIKAIRSSTGSIEW